MDSRQFCQGVALLSIPASALGHMPAALLARQSQQSFQINLTRLMVSMSFSPSLSP
jgi:hypothetical protein